MLTNKADCHVRQHGTLSLAILTISLPAIQRHHKPRAPVKFVSRRMKRASRLIRYLLSNINNPNIAFVS